MSRQDIDTVNQRLAEAVQKGDAAAAAALYTEDGKFLAPNADFLSGRAAIQGFFQAAIDGGIKGLNVSTLELEIQGEPMRWEPTNLSPMAAWWPTAASSSSSGNGSTGIGGFTAT